MNILVDILNDALFDIQLLNYRGVTLREYTVNRLTCLKKGEEESIDAVINSVLDERVKIGESN